jgi:hypothetical protein
MHQRENLILHLIFNKKRGLPEFLRSDMEKEEEKSIKEKLKEQYSFKEYHLEKFSINLEKYILSNEIIEENSYYVFDNNSNYVYLLNIES